MCDGSQHMQPVWIASPSVSGSWPANRSEGRMENCVNLLHCQKVGLEVYITPNQRLYNY